LSTGLGGALPACSLPAKEITVAITHPIHSPGHDGRSAGEPIVYPRAIEQAIVAGHGPEAYCLERQHLSQAEAQQPPQDGGYALWRGLLAGELVRHEARQFAEQGTLSTSLLELFDQALAGTGRCPLATDQVDHLRREVLDLVRGWQCRWPPEDDGLDWLGAVVLGNPRMPLVLRREDQFRIPVRPGRIFGVGDTLVTLEATASRSPSAITEAKVALLHHALLRAPFRRTDESRYASVAVRVELLALGSGVTIQLDSARLEAWRPTIGSVAEAIAHGHISKHVGPWCNDCPFQIPCFGDAADGGAF
jgi:hypothetical protein